MAGDAPTEAMSNTTAHHRPRVIRYITLYFVLGAIGSLAASFVGTLVVLAIMAGLSMGGLILGLLLAPQVIFLGFLQGLIWAAPLNFLLLPAAAFLIKRPILRELSFPIIGALGGMGTIFVLSRITERPADFSSTFVFFVIAGAIAGGVSGMFYARALYEFGEK